MRRSTRNQRTGPGEHVCYEESNMARLFSWRLGFLLYEAKYCFWHIPLPLFMLYLDMECQEEINHCHEYAFVEDASCSYWLLVMCSAL